MEEMEFLGMMRPMKSIEEQNHPSNPLKLKEKTEKDRREMRLTAQDEYEAAKETMKQEILENERDDIVAAETRKRQDWV